MDKTEQFIKDNYSALWLSLKANNRIALVQTMEQFTIQLKPLLSDNKLYRDELYEIIKEVFYGDMSPRHATDKIIANQQSQQLVSDEEIDKLKKKAIEYANSMLLLSDHVYDWKSAYDGWVAGYEYYRDNYQPTDKIMTRKILCFLGFHQPKSTEWQLPIYPYKRYSICKHCEKTFRIKDN